MTNAWRKFRRYLRAFRLARAGNVAVVFALASVPVIGFIGAGYDYSHANAVKADMQAALDSTALMLARNASSMTTSQLQSKASAYFTALFKRPEATIETIDASYSTSGGSSLTVTSTVKVPTTFLRTLNILGVKALDDITVNGSSTAAWGMTRLRVALVLDNTGSMADDGKMAALKAATKSLLSQLQSAASENGDVYVSIIPFAKDVNVGKSNYAANWIDWTDWDSANGHNQTTTTCNNSGNGYGYGSSGYGGYGGYGGSGCTTTTQWVPANHNSWNGCITDRGTPTPAPGSPAPVPDGSTDYDQSSITPDTSVTASLFPAEQYNACPVAMMGLSYDWTSMNSLVNSMQPNGGTNQPIGLVWGWQSLVGGGPLSVPAMDPGYKYQQAIILLSDGLNTQDRWYGNGSSTSTDVDHRMYDSNGDGTCANIKAAGITIYTIQVDTGGDPTSTLLQNCASSPKDFYLVTSSNDIANVFNDIGTNLTKLRVAK
jgi:Flp pilus assembly protein TadG